MGRSRYVGLALAAGLVLLVAVPAHADTGGGATYSVNPTGLLSSDTDAVASQCGNTPSAPLTADGQPITIHMPPGPDFQYDAVPSAWWRTPPSADGVWQLAFRGLIWAQSIAFKADYLGYNTTYARVAAQVKRFYAEDPDPGVPSSGGYGNSTAYGWDEGTSMRRLTTLNCLYSLRADAALVPLMQKEVNVQVCPRYYGPPCNAVHNHGLLANLAMWHAGDLTKTQAWMDTAETRLKNEAPLAFDDKGFMKEQSSNYQGINVKQWTNAANLIRTHDAAAAAAIDAVVAKARIAYAWMFWPTSTRFLQVGGSSAETAPYGYPGPQSGTSIIDDTYGWALGRFSWTDPNTTYYALRYGPAKQFHGTQDRPGLQWGTLGERVLVEPGTFGSDTTSNYVSYQNWVTSQNVAVPAGITISNVAVARSGASILGPSHAFTFTDNLWAGRAHSRYVAVYRDTRQTLVRDTFANDSSRTDNTFRQYWHLDSTWKLSSKSADGTSAVFKAVSGRTLTMTTTGRVSSIIAGQTNPPVGWHFPAWGSRSWSQEICLRRYGSTGPIETTFTVS